MSRPNHHTVVWRFGYSLCVRCGLLGLSNERTRKLLRAPCPGKDEDKP